MSTRTTDADRTAETVSAAGGEPGATPGPLRRRPLLLWSLLAGFILLQLGAWTAWLIVASRHHVEEVPLATGGRALGKP